VTNERNVTRVFNTAINLIWSLDNAVPRRTSVLEGNRWVVGPHDGLRKGEWALHGRISLPATNRGRAPSIAMTQHQLLVTSVHCSPRISSQLVFKCSRAQSLPTLEARIPQRRTFKCTPARAYRIQMSASIRFRGTKPPGLAQSPRQIRRTRFTNLPISKIFRIILSLIVKNLKSELNRWE